MEIRMRANGAIVMEQEFRRMFQNTSLPKQLTEEIINALGGDVVFEGPQASGGTQYQYSQRQGVKQVNGKWYTNYVLGPVFVDTQDATAAEQEAAYKEQKDAEQAKNVRTTRNKLLSDSDWTQVSDAPVDKATWATYRQALRDVSTQPGFPWEVTFPETPV